MFGFSFTGGVGSGATELPVEYWGLITVRVLMHSHRCDLCMACRADEAWRANRQGIRIQGSDNGIVFPRDSGEYNSSVTAEGKTAITSRRPYGVHTGSVLTDGSPAGQAVSLWGR
jgi:hypothetical protein